jgi:hypothetical protein
MFTLHLKLLAAATLYIGTLAQTDFDIKFQLRVIAPRDSGIRASRLLDSSSNDVSEGGEWVQTRDPPIITPLQDADLKSDYLVLTTFSIYKTSPDPWRLGLQDTAQGSSRHSTVSIPHLLCIRHLTQSHSVNSP